MTTQTSSPSISEHIAGHLGRGDYVGLLERSAPDVLLDMNLPTWRFQLKGQDEVVGYFRAQYEQMPTVRCTQFRIVSASNPVVVESECRFDSNAGEFLWRAVDIIQTEGDAITAVTQYCSGCWDPATIARQAAEAPMLRW